jgi:hypothetical protein
MAVAPSNGNVVYCATSTNIHRTTDGGVTWSTITGTLPVGSASISNIGVHSASPDTVWVTFSGFSAVNKVFRSNNGGTTWTNITMNLPNVPVSCIVQDPTSVTEGVYAGSDLGVFYTDNTLGTWVPYNTGLPNVIVVDLEIHAPSFKIVAGTHGRGLWRSDTYSFPTGTGIQVSNFSVQVYPNPNKGFFNVEFSALPEQAAIISVVDMDGKLILRQTTHAKTCTVDMTGFAPGNYIVKVRTGNHTKQMPVVLNR